MTRKRLSVVREREQRAAAGVLGVSSVTFLGELDGQLDVNLSTRKKVCREIRRLRPEVLVAPDPSRLWSGEGYINHWDHKQAGLLALTAVMPDAPTRLMFSELEDEGLEPYEVPNLWLAMNDSGTCVDITQTMDTKLRALAAHESQLKVEDVEKWVRGRAEELGKASEEGFAYAEMFKVFRFVDED